MASRVTLRSAAALFGLASFVLVAAACPVAPPTTGGLGGPAFRPVSDGGAAAGDDGGLAQDTDGGSGPGLGDACSPVTAPCRSGFVCVDNPYTDDPPTCAVDCSGPDGEDESVVCPETTSCQTVRSESLTTTLAVACLPIEYSRDRPCYAFEDDDACALDRMCLASDIDVVIGQASVSAMRCRDTCVLEAPNADASCSFGDVCMPDPEGGAVGLCGTPAPFLGVDDPITTADLCNEENDHRFCDREPFLDLDAPAIVACLKLGSSALPGDGLCIAVCGQPAFDYDGDGTVEATSGEGELVRDCPEGLACETGFSRRIGLLATGGSEIACDPEVCPEGTECGTCPPGAQCVTAPYFTTGPSVCAAVFGTCQPPEEGDGLMESDPADAGGESSGDAGAPVDAGAADGGSGRDGGEGVDAG